MIIKYFDRTEQVVTDAEAEKITSAINRGVAMIQIRGSMVNPKSIALIKPGGRTEADQQALTNPRIAAHDNRGDYSPALEKLRKRWGRDVPPSQQEAA